MSRFSQRHGFEPDDAEISIRLDAPEELRGVLVDIAYESGLSPHEMRSLVCRVLRTREDAGNWSAFPNVDNELRGHVDSCEWYEVYDILEAIYEDISERPRQRQTRFMKQSLTSRADQSQTLQVPSSTLSLHWSALREMYPVINGVPLGEF